MKQVGQVKEDLIIKQGMQPMSDQEHIEICKGPVTPEPVELVITECEIPEVPEPEATVQRRSNFVASDKKKGTGGLDSLGGGNLP